MPASQPVLAAFFSQVPGQRLALRPVLRRQEGEADGAQVANATAANLVAIDPAAQSLKKWMVHQVALRGFLGFDLPFPPLLYLKSNCGECSSTLSLLDTQRIGVDIVTNE